MAVASGDGPEALTVPPNQVCEGRDTGGSSSAAGPERLVAKSVAMATEIRSPPAGGGSRRMLTARLGLWEEFAR